MDNDTPLTTDQTVRIHSALLVALIEKVDELEEKVSKLHDADEIDRMVGPEGV